jgi:hypothetical protein
MASLACSAKGTGVRIAMALETAGTEHREGTVELSDYGPAPFTNAQRSRFGALRLVAERALCFLVRARSHELRHGVVVELGCPLLGPVALAAVLAQATVVLVVLLMAIVAGLLVRVVLLVGVAVFARQGLVLALEDEGLVLEVARLG